MSSNLIRLIQRMKSQWCDALCVIVILITSVIVYGMESNRLGFYADDASFLFGAPNLRWSNLAQSMYGYVTGRNLHMLWQFGIYQIFGFGLSDLGAHHWLQAFFSGLNAVILYIAIRLFAYQPLVAFIAGIVFAFYPNHAEVQHWLSSLPMNLISTFFVLMQIIMGTLFIKRIVHNKTGSSNKFLLVSFTFYVCALFTYDQVVPLVVTISSVIGLIAVTNKKIRWAGITYLVASLGLFAFLLVWKVNVPAGGPILNNINVDHIWYTFNLSLLMMFGFHLQNGIQTLIVHADLHQKLFAITSVLVISSTALLIFWQQFKDSPINEVSLEENARLPWHSRFITIQGIKFLFPIIFYLLAYLPVFIWYIAPRHNYLPSIGVAFGIAFAFNFLLWVSRLMLGKWGFLLMGWALIVISMSFVYKFIKADLVEKQVWIASYQARKNLYYEFEKSGNLRSGMALVIGGIPTITPYGSAYFGYQPSTDVELITEGRIKLKYLDRNIQATESGVYLLSSANDYGLNAFHHAPWVDALVLQYEGFTGERIQYKVVSQHNTVLNYSLKNSRPLSKLQPEKFVAYIEKGILKIEMPNIAIGRGEVITLLPFIQAGDKKVPLTFNNTANVPLSFLIEVPQRFMGKSFELFLPVDLPLISGIQLYISNGDKVNRLLAEVPVLTAMPTMADGVDLSK